MGAVYFGLQLYWIAAALLPRSILGLPAYLLSVGVLAGMAGAFAWAVHFTRERIGLPIVLGTALFWTTLEWVQARAGDVAFPWLGLGHALAPFPILAGAADLVGARGLTLWIAAINGLVAVAIVRLRVGRRPGSDPRPHSELAARPDAAVRPGAAVRLGGGLRLGGAMLLLALPPAYGVWRGATLDTRPVARVAVVQPNIAQEIRLDRALAVDTSVAMLARLTRQVAGLPVDLVAWPEVAIPVDLAASPELLGWAQELSREAGAPILVGAYGADPPPAEQPAGVAGTAGVGTRTFNSAFLLHPGGLAGKRYDKQRLVPFVERVPFVTPARLPGLRDGRPRYANLAPGAPAMPLKLGTAYGETRFGVLICYESAFHELARQARRGGAEFVVNITNDAWFGQGPRLTRTTALWQHPAHLVMRAIENRVGVARAANTGISLYVDPLGRTHQATSLSVPDVRVHTLLTTDSVTLFTRRGDWLATLAAAAGLALVLLARLRPGPAGLCRRERLPQSAVAGHCWCRALWPGTVRQSAVARLCCRRTLWPGTVRPERCSRALLPQDAVAGK
jgi:apolipoprotein N-acyltransferase